MRGSGSRLQRLEARQGARTPPVFRYGCLHALPADYAGERHIVMLSSEPTGSPHIERRQFEERPGKGPKLDDSDGPTVYLTYEAETA
jgi:hypothetical protein